MTTFIIIACTWLTIILLNLPWVRDICLAWLGWQDEPLSDLSFLLQTAGVGYVIGIITFVLAIVGLCRKRQRRWNIAALVLSLPPVLMILISLMELGYDALEQ